jgi:uncharacterized membrane protein YeaQ/YmgE (transglycosylase-associated protein family)
MQLLLFTVFGFVCGTALHSWLLPARHDMGLAATTVLGLAGSLAGRVYGPRLDVFDLVGLHPASFIASVIGACCMVLIGDQALRIGPSTARSVARELGAMSRVVEHRMGQKVPRARNIDDT